MLKIGIPVLNRGDLLTRLVESIDLEAEVLIVLNQIGPVDESVAAAVEALEKRPPGHLRVKVHRVEGNLGGVGELEPDDRAFRRGLLDREQRHRFYAGGAGGGDGAGGGGAGDRAASSVGDGVFLRDGGFHADAGLV